MCDVCFSVVQESRLQARVLVAMLAAVARENYPASMRSLNWSRSAIFEAGL